MRFWPWLLCFAVSCSSEPDNPPLGGPLSDECDACLVSDDAGGGCGVPEAACAARTSCDQALLCALNRSCWKRAAGVDCAAEFGCPTPEAADAPLLDAIESCARGRCAEACGFAP